MTLPESVITQLMGARYLFYIAKQNIEAAESGATEENAAYILEQTIDIALRLEEHERGQRILGQGNFIVRLNRDGVNIYEKADRKSTVKAVTADGLREIDVTEETVGLDGGGPYWKVAHLDRDRVEMFYFGYVHNDDLDWSTPIEENDKTVAPA